MMLRRLMMAGGGVGTVSFVAARGASYVTGTSVSLQAPAGMAVGDVMFAVVFARSALTTPTGWSLIASKSNTGTLLQTLYVYQKVVSASDLSETYVWSQTSTARIGVAYVAIRSSSGTVNVAEHKSAAYNNETASTARAVPVESLRTQSSGEMVLVAISNEVANSSPATNSWQSSAGAVVRTQNPVAEGRLCVATQSLASGADSVSQILWSTTGGGGQTYCATLSIRLAA